jgi:hypothetical protein
MTLDKPKWTSQGPGVRADAQCYICTWLEELASESNSMQAQGTITALGRASNYVKIYMELGQFSFNNFGLMCSFGLGLFVDLDMINLNGWKPVQCDQASR